MNYKQNAVLLARKLRFESSVISYGSQTENDGTGIAQKFESSVISYGSQTMPFGTLTKW